VQFLLKKAGWIESSAGLGDTIQGNCLYGTSRNAVALGPASSPPC
jgi:hypothetical protein